MIIIIITIAIINNFISDVLFGHVTYDVTPVKGDVYSVGLVCVQHDFANFEV